MGGHDLGVAGEFLVDAQLARHQVRERIEPGQASSEGDERVIGHEIVSSGLAQSSFFARSECMRRLEEWFPEFVDEQLTSRSLGRYHGASFVELFVGAGADNGTPRVEVRFHTGAGASERRVELTRDATRTTGPALFAVPPAEK